VNNILFNIHMLITYQNEEMRQLDELSKDKSEFHKNLKKYLFQILDDMALSELKKEIFDVYYDLLCKLYMLDIEKYKRSFIENKIDNLEHFVREFKSDEDNERLSLMLCELWKRELDWCSKNNLDEEGVTNINLYEHHI